MLAATITRTLELAKGTTKRFYFPLVTVFLALGQLESFKHFFHFIERLAQRLNNLVYLFDSLLNCRWRSRDPGLLVLPLGWRFWFTRFTRFTGFTGFAV